MKRRRSHVATKLRQQDQGCHPLVLQLEGKIRQACLNTGRHEASSSEHYMERPFVLCQPEATDIIAGFLSTVFTHEF